MKKLTIIIFLEIFLVVSLFITTETSANGIGSNLEENPDPGLCLDPGNCLSHARRLLNPNAGVKISAGRGGGSIGGSRGGGSVGGTRGGGSIGGSQGGSNGGSRSRGDATRGAIIGGIAGAGVGMYHGRHSRGPSKSNGASSIIPMKFHVCRFSSLIFLILFLS
ncbi:hypothetical protein FEM48_Zijuj01G0170800 [Ziziphus jujuba var. spinosa]|uniref:Uncharacterized protein n=1 Tax=Ziziphus jujuba var. spinosa TaxID=714518 RepID=A0A978W2H4_ZIZJJ|nr:hypothetical protein FEM48_Zijuj01G0170800 [Ziziphus jujuba var. spinosa]